MKLESIKRLESPINTCSNSNSSFEEGRVIEGESQLPFGSYLGYPSRRFVKMIARVWRGIGVTEKANGYVDRLQRAVLPELYQMDGFRGAYLLRRNLDEGVEFTVQTFWESMDAIRKFAGENVEAAVAGVRLLTRGISRYRTYFPTLNLIVPE